MILKLKPELAPIKVAVLPLAKNKPEIVEMAKLKKDLQPSMRAVYDDTGGIGKLYARQDEIGTPFCVTVDHESLEDNAVTVRDRDTWEQKRISLENLKRASSRSAKVSRSKALLRVLQARQIRRIIHRVRYCRCGIAHSVQRKLSGFRIRARREPSRFVGVECDGDFPQRTKSRKVRISTFGSTSRSLASRSNNSSFDVQRWSITKCLYPNCRWWRNSKARVV